MRNSHKLNVWLTLFVATLVGMFGVNVAAGYNSASFTSQRTQIIPITATREPLVPYQIPTAQPICPPNCDHVIKEIESGRTATEGLIIKLSIPFIDENLLSMPQIMDQREKLRKGFIEFNDYLLSIGKGNMGVLAAYHSSPYILIRFLSSYKIEVLTSQSLVEHIYAYKFFGEYSDLGLSKVTINLQELTNTPLELYQNNTVDKCVSSIKNISCKEFLNLSKNQNKNYVNVLIGIKLMYKEVASSGFEFNKAESAMIIQHQYKILQNYRPYILSKIGTTIGIPYIHTYVLHEAIDKMMSDPDISYITIGWDKFDASENQHYIPKMNQSDRTLSALSTPTFTPTYRPPGTNLRHINFPENNLPSLADKEIIIIDDGVIMNHPHASNRVSSGRCIIPKIQFMHYPPTATGTAQSTPTPYVATEIAKCYDPNNPPTPSDRGDDARPCFPDHLYPVKNPYNCGHGSLQAGIMISDNNQYPGIVKDITLYPIRIGYQAHLTDAIQEAAARYRLVGKVVSITISLSWGLSDLANSGYCAPENDTINQIFKNLKSKGVLTFIASGNDGEVGRIHSPACFPDAISVGAVEPHDPGPEKVWDGSNTYPHLSLYAPGYGWGFSVQPGQLWQEWSTSTSQAAPQAAAVWALYRQRYSDVPISKLVEMFLALPGGYYGYLGKVVEDKRATATRVPTSTPIPAITRTAPVNLGLPPHVKLRSKVPRVDLSKVGQPKVWIPNVNYDYVPSTGVSVTPPLSCDYLTAGLDCTLREAVAAALPQDVISFL
jgi:hypothetical protein